MTDRDTCKEMALEYNAIRLAERVAKLEAQLTDEKVLREAQENALNQCCKRRALLEAQCAAMQSVLHDGVPHTQKNCVCEKKYSGECWWCRAYAALSSKAGEKVLAVVRAAKNLNKWRVAVNTETARGRRHYRTEMTDSERALDEALSDLGWEL